MGEVQWITDRARAGEVAADLNGGKRRRPAVVVSVPTGATEPLIDVKRIATELGELAEVFVLMHDCSWHFTGAMPSRTQVYGGAGRVYPIGLEWVHDPYRAPLRFAYGQTEAEAAATALIDDALGAALQAGLLSAERPPSGASPAAATVVGCPTPSQAVVQLDTGGYATVQIGVCFPGITADRVLTTGMRVNGLFDPHSRHLDIRPSLPDPLSRLDSLPDGCVAPARIGAVSRSSCQLFLHPLVALPLSWDRVTTSPDDDLRDLLSVGETVAVRITRAADGPPAFSMLEAAGSACGPALSVLPGGPPWLKPPDDAQGRDDAQGQDDAPGSARDKPVSVPAAAPPPQAVARPLPARPTPLLMARRPLPAGSVPEPLHQPKGKALRDMSLALDASRAGERAARSRLRDVEAELFLLERDLAVARRELEARDEALRKLRRLHRRSRQSEAGSAKGPANEPDLTQTLFPTAEQQFRFEVELSWARRIPAAEKESRPLRRYSLGPRFLDSLAGIHGVDRSKVLDVVVEVLTGLAETSGGREMHQLRSGTHNEEFLRRDGRTCWRVALQQNTPSARRLHFWRGADEIELSRVVLHDDFLP